MGLSFNLVLPDYFKMRARGWLFLSRSGYEPLVGLLLRQHNKLGRDLGARMRFWAELKSLGWVLGFGNGGFGSRLGKKEETARFLITFLPIIFHLI